MYKYVVWPGAYSFKEEIELFLTYLKDQFKDLAMKVENTEEAARDAAAVD